MKESTFTWIASNVFQRRTDQPFSSSIQYKILPINEIRILFIV